MQQGTKLNNKRKMPLIKCFKRAEVIVKNSYFILKVKINLKFLIRTIANTQSVSNKLYRK